MDYLIEPTCCFVPSPCAIPSGRSLVKPSRLCSNADWVCALLHKIWWNCGTSAPGRRNTTALAKTIAATDGYLRFVESFFAILPETPELFTTWRELVVTYQVSGTKVHDARLVAAMTLHHVSRILTFNTQDFGRYRHIEAINPTTV